MSQLQPDGDLFAADILTQNTSLYELIHLNAAAKSHILPAVHISFFFPLYAKKEARKSGFFHLWWSVLDSNQ